MKLKFKLCTKWLNTSTLKSLSALSSVFSGKAHHTHVWLAGVYLVVAAGLSTINVDFEAAPRKVVLPQPIKKQVDITSPKAPLKTPFDLMKAVKNVQKLSDFTELPLSTAGHALVERMLKDEFEQDNPFQALNSVYAVALILNKAVVKFRRDVYRSPEFSSGFGYDIVKYEISHPDQTLSHIIAYKEKTASGQTEIGRRDLRPVFALFATPQGDGKVFVSRFENGELKSGDVTAQELVLTSIFKQVQSSTPLLSSLQD